MRVKRKHPGKAFLPGTAGFRAALHRIWIPLAALALCSRPTDHAVAAGYFPSVSHESSNRLLIGLIDTGFDLKHPDLLRDGRSRVFVVWDQRDSSRTNGPDGATAVYDAADLDQSTVLPDYEGHGTAVASVIFAGDHEIGELDAELVCVCVPEEALQEQVAAGVNFIRQIAERTRRPYLINLSIGFPGGAKDGVTDELEFAIRDLFLTDSLGLLKQVVSAAGNSNYDSLAVDDLHTASLPLREAIALENRRSHARGNGPGTFGINLTTSPLPADDSCIIEFWYSASRPYATSIQTPGRAVVVAPLSPGVWTPDPAEIAQKFGYVQIENRGPVQGPGSEPPRWWSTKFTLRDDTTLCGPLMGGTWTVELLSGIGIWDAYITVTAPTDYKKAIVRDQGSNECMIEVGGNVPQGICVGAYNPFDSCGWTTVGARQVTLAARLQGRTISHFSSRGPNRLGFEKPDIYAPGECCLVALSGGIRRSEKDEILASHLLTEDRMHFVTEGTSYAAPIVTRVLAGILTERPCLRPDQLKHILIASADHLDDHGKLAFLVNPEKAIKASRQVNCR